MLMLTIMSVDTLKSRSFCMFPQEENRIFRIGVCLKMIRTGMTTMILQLSYNYLTVHHRTVFMPAYVMTRKLATFVIIYRCNTAIIYVYTAEHLEQG